MALRLLADGQEVVDVPPTLSAQARVFSTGQGPHGYRCHANTGVKFPDTP
ncbi:hypothetical protein NSZ01_27300 [Nocardioides szechwanensis]|nr:hypothetical protein NSZ01_27300 [Nocardioides szechwanensis]